MYESFEVITSSFAEPALRAYKMSCPLQGDVLAIRYSRDEICVLTKEQAMRFFGLVDPKRP